MDVDAPPLLWTTCRRPGWRSDARWTTAARAPRSVAERARRRPPSPLTHRPGV